MATFAVLGHAPAACPRTNVGQLWRRGGYSEAIGGLVTGFSSRWCFVGLLVIVLHKQQIVDFFWTEPSKAQIKLRRVQLVQFEGKQLVVSIAT